MRFRIRELSRDVVSVLLLLVGVLICSLVMITAFYLRDSATHYIDNIEENLKYDYIYTLKYQPIQKLNLNDDSEIMVISTFLYDDNGSEREFMVQGINANSKFYDMSKINVMQEDEIIISSCVAQKYGYEVNDSITLKEKLSNKKHHFKIIDIYNFDFSQICFTSQENINNLLNVNKEYYNGIIASEKENLDDDYIYSISTKSETVSYANNLIAKIKVMSSLILVVSVILLISIIFLMLKMVIEKNKTNIALVKIFGYTRKEIKKLYTSGNIIIVIAGFLLANPLAYMIAKKFYIGIFATSQQFFVPYINFYDRWIGLTVAMIGYGISIFLLNETILKVKFSEVLKSRE
jgi:putative ABC transport system permease protein